MKHGLPLSEVKVKVIEKEWINVCLPKMDGEKGSFSFKLKIDPIICATLFLSFEKAYIMDMSRKYGHIVNKSWIHHYESHS